MNISKVVFAVFAWRLNAVIPIGLVAVVFQNEMTPPGDRVWTRIEAPVVGVQVTASVAVAWVFLIYNWRTVVTMLGKV
jgi:hypothetical protein